MMNVDGYSGGLRVGKSERAKSKGNYKGLKERDDREGGFIAMEEKEDVTDQYKEKGGRGWGGKRKKCINRKAKTEVMGDIQERQSKHQKQRQSE